MARWRGRSNADSASTGPTNGDIATWDVATGEWVPTALDPNLAAIALLTTTTFGRSLLTAATAAAARTLLGVLAITKGATGARPAAATAGAGAEYYDTTLGYPIWSNGTAWTDAAGNVVV